MPYQFKEKPKSKRPPTPPSQNIKREVRKIGFI
jgi:hypothetical protein